MPADPIDTHSLTTHDAPKGGAWCSHLPPATRSFGVSEDKLLSDRDDEIARLMEENADLRAQLAASQAEVERLKAEVQSAEQGESEANGVMDNIDTQVGDALESLGLDTLAGTGFPWRVDALVEAAKEYKAEIGRLSAREAETAKRCEAVVAAVDAIESPDRASWTAVPASIFLRLRTAVDAIRPATTEARS